MKGCSMETNESILTKGVVSVDDRKQMGNVKGVVIDCDTCGVSHYVVSSSSTNTALVLPFGKSLSVGDTFMTIQSRNDFLATTDLTARGALEDNFDLVGLDVFSRAGNRLGVIKGFDIDTTFGKITKIDLEDGESFPRESFVFFAPEFVFVDDGTRLEAELRAESARAAGADAEDDASPLDEPAGAENAAPEEAGEDAVPALDDEKAGLGEDPEKSEDDAAVADAGESAPEEAEEAQDEKLEAAEPELAESDPDAELKEFLLGKTLNERVVGKDGAFVAERGTQLTREVLIEAQRHDALLLLTMSVDE